MSLHSAIPVPTVMNFHHGLLDFSRNTGGAVMSDDARKLSVKAYFDGLSVKDMSRVPWAKDATLRTPLNPAGGESALILGRKAILDFFNSILPAVGNLRFLRYYLGDGGWVAGQAELTLANSKTLYVLDAFHVEDGEIVEQQNHYDPRPATG